jgi:hypothetical protein
MEQKCFLCDEETNEFIDCQCGKEKQASKGKDAHCYCKSCFQNYIYSKVEYLTKEKKTIKCAAIDCQEEFDKRFIRNSDFLSCEQYEYYLYKLMSLEPDKNPNPAALARANSTPREQLFHEGNILNILSLKCPNEKCSCLVMIDSGFKDCFKLTCDHCSHHICGWCFRDLGTVNDYHHIANCLESENPGQVYAKSKPYETFYQKQHKRMVKNIISYLLSSIVNDVDMRCNIMKSLESNEQMRIIYKVFPKDFWKFVDQNELTNKILSEYIQLLTYQQLETSTAATRNPLPVAAPPPPQAPPPRQPLNILRSIETYVESLFQSLEFLYRIGVRVFDLIDSPEQYLVTLTFIAFLPFFPNFIKLLWKFLYFYYLGEKCYSQLIPFVWTIGKHLIHFGCLKFFLPFLLRKICYPIISNFKVISLLIFLISGLISYYKYYDKLRNYYQRIQDSFTVLSWASIIYFSFQYLYSFMSNYLLKLYQENLTLTSYYPKDFLLYLCVIEIILLLRRLTIFYYRGKIEFLQMIFFIQFAIPYLLDGIVSKPIFYEGFPPLFIRIMLLSVGGLIFSQISFFYLAEEVVKQVILRRA